MPATVRIDFDVHSESISAALGAELEKVKGVTTSANNAISAANTARVNKDVQEFAKGQKSIQDLLKQSSDFAGRAASATAANEAKLLAQSIREKERAEQIAQRAAAATAREAAKAEAAQVRAAERAAKEAEKVANAEIREAQRAAAAQEKEAKKLEDYKMKLRMQSIKDANAAEEKAARQNKPKPEHHEGISAGEVIGFGAAIEGLKIIKEKAEEATAANKALQAGTGLVGEELVKAGEDAEAIGHKFAVGGEQGKEAMGKVASYTGATGEELKKQTEAVVAYGVAHNKNAGMVAKMFATEQGRAKILSEANLNIAKAQAAANQPAVQAEEIQRKFTETIGKLAVTALTALGPALQAINPIMDVLGGLVTSVVEPALKAISPVIGLIANGLKDLAPIVIELVTNAFGLLTPILDAVNGLMAEMLPIVVDVIKTVATALSPVFKALTPVIVTVAEVLKDLLAGNLKVMLIPTLEILIPIIRDVLAPTLLALMPLLQAVADIAKGVLVPAMNAVSGVLQFIVSNAIQPLVKWFTGGLTSAIKSTVEVITVAVAAISKVVNGVMSFLGLGDKAADETKKAGGKVLDAQKEIHEKQELADQQHRLKEDQAHVAALTNKLKLGKLSAQEEAELREHAADESNDALLAKLDAFDKKKQTHASTAAKKAAKDEFEESKKASDAAFELKKYALLTQNLTEKAYKEESLKLQIEHDKELIAIADKFKKDHLSISTSLINDTRALNKSQFELRKLDFEAQSSDELEEVENDGKKTFELKRKSLVGLMELAKQYGQETTEFQKKIDDLEKEERKRLHKQELDEAKAQIAAIKDLEKARLDAMPAGIAKELAMIKSKYEQDVEQHRQALKEKKLTQKEFDDFEALAAQKQRNEIVAVHKQEAEAIIQEAKDANAFIAKSGKDRVDAIKAFLLQELAHYVATKYAEVVATETTEAQKSAFTIAGVAERVAAVAVGIASDIAAAAANAFEAVTSAISSIMAIIPFPFSLAVVPGAIAGVYGLYQGAKALFGFEKGGYTGSGRNDELAGPVHKNEYVLKSGSFSVDAFGNLVTVGGVGGGGNSVVSAIQHQTELLGKAMGKRTVINQRRMVLENKFSQLSLSRESV
jgi:hypothetical protein